MNQIGATTQNANEGLIKEGLNKVIEKFYKQREKGWKN